VWAYLHEQRLHNRGMVAEDEYRRLGTQESEFVAAYCRRLSSCSCMQSVLANANREVPDVSMVETVLQGIERERPEWTVARPVVRAKEERDSCRYLAGPEKAASQVEEVTALRASSSCHQGQYNWYSVSAAGSGGQNGSTN
jgi:hypothetical protein